MHHSELRSRRRLLGLSQAELARRLDINQSTVSRWERGEMPIENGGMLRLALQHLELDLEEEHRAEPREETHALNLRRARELSGDPDAG